MQNYDLHGVRRPHWDYRHRETLHDLPDMEQIMKDKVKDILWEAERIEPDEDTKSRLDSTISLVQDLAKDVPDEMKAFTEQHNAREAMIADMTYAALEVTRSLDHILDIVNKSGVNTPITNLLREHLEEARGQCDEIFTTSSQRLHDLLFQFGWRDNSRCIVKRFLGQDFNPFLTVDTDLSRDPSNITMTYNNWLEFDGSSTLDMHLDERMIIISCEGKVTMRHIKETPVRYVNHALADLLSHFEDFMNPTQAELAVYAMAIDKTWDILSVKAELESKTKSKP